MNRAHIAWVLAGASLAGAVVDTAVTASFRPLLSQDSVALHGWPLATLATVGSSAMGALIISRHPRSIIGWLLALVGVISSFSLLAESYQVWVVDHHGPGGSQLGHLGGWVSLLFGAPVAFAGLSLVLLLAPDGRLLSRRWRVAVALVFVGLGSWEAGVLLTPPHAVVIDSDSTGGSAAPRLLFTIGLFSLLAAMVLSLLSVVRRYRRARGVVRQQLRWIAVWAGSLPVGLLVLLLLDGAYQGDVGWLARLPLLISYDLMPVCLAISVLRYRLYDIDVIINRTVLLTVGTAFAAAGYIALVVVTGDLVGSQANSLWLSVLATAAIALAFQPLRRKVVRLADRLAYGGRAVPYEELAAFSRKLGESPDERRLLPAIAQAAALAVSAEHATAQLFVLDGSERLGCWPADAKPGDETVEFPVIDQGEQLGRIAVRMPPGRALRRADDALLVDLAAQTALAFRNAQLATELAGRVAQLDRRTEQLASSRARVIQARDAERFRLEMAIRREVISHLVDLPARLDAMSRSAQPPGPALGAMIEQSVDALEALRELTRGIYSTQLSQFGLASAVSAHVRRRSGNGAFTADATMRGRRFGQRTESAAYFCCVTAMRELAAPIAVDLAVRNDRLMVTMRSAPSPAGPDLVHLQDRLDPLAGTVAWLEAAERSILTITMPAQVGA